MALIGVVSGVAVHYAINNDKHTKYKVIGSQYCNDSVPGVSTLYTGVIVGFQSDTGFVDHQCMPIDNSFIQYYNESNYGNETVTYGNLVKYNTFLHKNNMLRNKTVACALCQINGRETIKILPAMYDCPEGWTKQYQGYLMTGGLCVHTDMKEQEMILISKYLYLQHEIMWDIPNYNSDKVLSCVVCSI